MHASNAAAAGGTMLLPHHVVGGPHPPVGHNKVAVVDAEIMRCKHEDAVVDHAHVRVSHADAGQNERIAGAGAAKNQRNQNKCRGGTKGHAEYPGLREMQHGRANSIP